MQQTPLLTFRLKGNSTNTDLRIVCKNMSANHEDWWYTEQFNLADAEWHNVTVDMRTLQAFDWYNNTDESNKMEGVVRISFGVSTGNAVAGTFRLDDLRLSGDIYPAPDYAQTVIVRKDSHFPASPDDGTEVYRGMEETCTDPSAVVGQVYYYAAFAADDRGNWSAADEDAQWISRDVQETSTGTCTTTSVSAQKFLYNGHLYICNSSGIYSMLGKHLLRQ